MLVLLAYKRYKEKSPSRNGPQEPPISACGNSLEKAPPPGVSPPCADPYTILSESCLGTRGLFPPNTNRLLR